MKTTLTYGELDVLGQCLNRMSGLTDKYGFAIAKTKRSLASEVGVFQELKDNLVIKYGTKRKDGTTSIKPGDENWVEFVKLYNELCAKKVDVEIFQVEGFELDDVFCPTANADDYVIFEDYMVVKDDKPAESERDTEEAE